MYEKVTSPETRTNAMISAGAAAAATLAPWVAYHLMHGAAGGGISAWEDGQGNSEKKATKCFGAKAAVDAGLGTVAGIVGGAVGGPAGSVAAGLMTSTFTYSAAAGVIGALNGAKKAAAKKEKKLEH